MIAAVVAALTLTIPVSGGDADASARVAAFPSAASPQSETSSADLTTIDAAGLVEPEVTAPSEGAEAVITGVTGDEVALPDGVTAAGDALPRDEGAQVEEAAPDDALAQDEGAQVEEMAPDDALAQDEGAQVEEMAPEDTRVIVGLTAGLNATEHDVHVVGASWEAGPVDVSVDIRVKRGDEWGAWEVLPVETAAEGDDDSTRAGSHPYVATGVEDVQVRLLTGDGIPPVDARLDVFSADVTPADAAAAAAAPSAGSPFGLGVGALPGTTTSAAESYLATPIVPTAAAGESRIWAPFPTIRSRSLWGAAAPVSEMAIGSVNGATVHHTAGTNNYAQSEVPAILRGIQHFHIYGRDWSDIGYNFLIDNYGRIWEGRAGGVNNTTRGVHASSFNSITTGISVMGNFETATVNAATRKALIDLIAWKLALHGVEAGGTLTGLDGRTYPAVVGHRDVPEAATACPGRNLYPLLPSLRSGAAGLQMHVREHVIQDVNADGVPDITDLSGVGQAYLGVDAGSTSPFAPMSAIGANWHGINFLAGSPPLIRGAAGPDLFARVTTTGQLRIYHGNGRGGFAGVSAWGRGWNAMSAIITPGDWTGDGLADLIAIHQATGKLFLYRGNGRGGVAPAQQIGRGWGGMRSVVAVGDFDGDGHGDLAALTATTGKLLLYRGNGRGGFAGVTTIATDLPAYREVIALGDVTADGLTDLLLRPMSGDELVTVRGDGRGGATIGAPWSTGWGARTLMAGIRAWNGAGRSVVVSVDATTGQLHSAEASTAKRFSAGAAVGLPAGTVKAAVVGDVTGSGGSSVVALRNDDRLFLSAALGDGTFAAPRQIGQGWGGFDQIAAAGDMNYDGVTDLLALGLDGRLFVYPFAADGSGTLGEPFQIGHGFGAYRVFGVGGWSSATGSDVLAIHKTTGDMRWYVGHGTGRLTGGSVISTGWGRLADISAIGDMTGAGNNDLVARDTVTGLRWIYRADGSGRILPGRQAVAGIPTRTGP